MLNDLVDPILAAVHRHAARLQLLERCNPHEMYDYFRQESACICKNDIRNIGQSGFQALVDAEPDPVRQVRVLADSQKHLRDLVCLRLPQAENRPAEGYYSIFVEGSAAAARAVYAKVSQCSRHNHLSERGGPAGIAGESIRGRYDK